MKTYPKVKRPEGEDAAEDTKTDEEEESKTDEEETETESEQMVSKVFGNSE